MNKYYFIISGFFLIFAYVNPIHYNPWSAYIAIISAIISLIFLIPILSKKIIYIPKFTLLILFFSTIVWIQYFIGIVFHLNTAIIVSSILVFFWLSIVLGYNISIINQDKIISYLGIIFIISGVFSSILAIFQWLQIDSNSYLIIQLSGRGNRMVANIGQPNQLATLLLLSVISCFYFFESNKINKYLLCIITVLCVFSIVLTQSRTAWIVALCIAIYYIYSKRDFCFKINGSHFFSWIAFFFALTLSLPIINKLLSKYFNVVFTDTMLERISSGYLRFNIWEQMFHALMLKPWIGYGWFQTSTAQYAVIDHIHGVEWTTSAHNILLDILVWNGVIFGLIIIIYILYYFIKPIFKVKSRDCIFASMMIITIGTHAMLEYPIFYTYFLLPLGLCIGVTLSEFRQKEYLVSAVWLHLLMPLVLIFIWFFNNQYNVIMYNFIGANLSKDRLSIKDGFITPYQTPLFDNFNAQIKWIALNPYQKIDPHNIEVIKQTVSLNLTQYNLYKFSIILMKNNQVKECQHVLQISKVMFGNETSCDDVKLKIDAHNKIKN